MVDSILTNGFLLLEYIRPQEIVQPLRALHAGLVLQLALFIVLIARRKVVKLNRIQAVFFLVLIFLMMLQVPLAVNNYYSFHLFTSMVLYFAVFLFITSFVNEIEELWNTVKHLLIVIVFCAVLGVWQGGKINGSALMGDENDFSLAMNIGIPLAYFMLLEAESFLKRILYFGIICLLVSANVLSVSRGGFIGMVIVFVYCWVYTKRKLLVATVAGLVLLAGFSLVPKTYYDEIASIKSENIETGTGAVRWYYWGRAFDMFLDHPIMGVGQGNFPWRISEYESEGFNNRSHGGRQAHSVYFTVLPELGSLGFICFLGIIWTIFRDSFRFVKLAKLQIFVKATENNAMIKSSLQRLLSLTYALRGSLIGYLISGIFLSAFYYPHFWLLTALLVCANGLGQSALLASSDAVDQNA